MLIDITNFNFECGDKGGSVLIDFNFACDCNNNGGTETPYDITSTFNVTNTTSPTQLCNSSAILYFTEMYVDGNKIDVSSGYTFNTTGEHTVNYMLADKTKIGKKAFASCYDLNSIYIQTSVTSIGSWAFSNCNFESITIPDSVTSIGDYAFNGCQRLTSITIPNGVTKISNNTFIQCYSLTSVTIPDSVTSIGNSAFNFCTSLKSITIPNNVTSIGYAAFGSCTSLKSITIPNNVTSIKFNAFKNCSDLTSVTIGSGITSIGNEAFSGCTSLNSITCYATTAPSLGSDVFNSLQTSGTLYIPNGSDYSTWTSILNNWTIQYI